MEHGEFQSLKTVPLSSIHKLIYSPNGKETQKVVEAMTGLDWQSLDVEFSDRKREVVHAIVGKDIATNLGVELTGALRSTDRNRKVVMIALNGRTGDLRRRLAGRVPAVLEGKTYSIISKRLLLSDPNRVVDMTKQLLEAQMPKTYLETEG